MTTAKSYDKLNRLAGMISTPSDGGQLPFSYGASYNEANQRTQTTLNDESYWLYTYDDMGHLKTGKKYFAPDSLVPGQQFVYNYDHIGNRSTTYAGGDQNGGFTFNSSSYTRDTILNHYTSKYRAAAVNILGSADAGEDVYVNDVLADYRNGEYFWSRVRPLTSTPVWFEIKVATSGGVTNVGRVFFSRQPEYFTYDLDGNMLSDGRWNYTWDAENRLTSMTVNTNVGPQLQLYFQYDWMGRRISKTVKTNGVTSYSRKFLYDGWNLIAELDGNKALVRSYTWGLDASGSMQGAGGVGGLLMVNAGSGGVHFPAYDLNGNVMGLVNATNGIISAKYEYGPFGEVFCSVGDMAKVNPFQFSTKYTDNETDLVYYGYRYYSPALGRWLSRDPIEEKGGLNLYGFCNNDPVNKWDRLGQLTPPSYYIVFPPEPPPLDEWKFDDIPSFNLPSKAMPRIKKTSNCLQECGSVITRAIEPEPNPTKWEKIHEGISMIYYPHVFLILADGTRKTHGGTTNHVDHWTARAWPIYIREDASCEKFTECVKNNWPPDSSYGWKWHNCQYAVDKTLKKCGAVRRYGRYWGWIIE